MKSVGRDRDRLVDTLTGNRLIAAVGAAIVNLALFIWLSFDNVHLNDLHSSMLISVIAAQVGVVALFIGATTIRLSIKMAIVSINTLWAIALIENHWGIDSVDRFSEFAFPLQAAGLLFGASLVHGATKRYFQTSDLLVLITASAILMPIGQSISSVWRDAAHFKIVLAGTVFAAFHSIWVFAILRFLLDPNCWMGRQTGYGIWIVAIVIGTFGLVTMELAVARFVTEPIELSAYVATRGSFVAWTAFSLAAIINYQPQLSAHRKSQDPEERL